jgi:hypothetical protein
VPAEDKATMSALEVEVCLACEFKEDVEVDFQVGGVILELGCSRTKNSKFFHTLELYWHVKTMVALGMLPKDEDFFQLKSIMEMLESQNEYLLKVVTWLARKHGAFSNHLLLVQVSMLHMLVQDLGFLLLVQVSKLPLLWSTTLQI